MNRAAVSIALLACLVGLGESQSRGYQRLLGENALRKYCSEDGEECMFSTHCCRGLYCAVQGNVGTCLTHLSALTKCLSDADCPETKCCHRQRHHGGFGICAYVCNDIGTASTVPFDKPVGSYRGGDFWKLWAHKRHVTFPHRHKRQW
uniref:Conotoxin n=1 Tax=Mesocestoides corti TaxID=53468 RepID=A0A5K3ER81_MESCO